MAYLMCMSVFVLLRCSLDSSVIWKTWSSNDCVHFQI